jgi:hypothetical protein
MINYRVHDRIKFERTINMLMKRRITQIILIVSAAAMKKIRYQNISDEKIVFFGALKVPATK